MTRADRKRAKGACPCGCGVPLRALHALRAMMAMLTPEIRARIDAAVQRALLDWHMHGTYELPEIAP